MFRKFLWTGILGAGLLGTGQALANDLRIVNWNIEADIDGFTTPRPGVNTVLQGIGSETIGGTAQPIDILALEETTSNATTVQPIVDGLNGDYPTAKYQMSAFQAGESNNFTASGNGPSAVVYNADTVKLIASVGVGTPGGASNGEYRQVVRYEFQPIGSSAPFYIYVSHMKSGTTAADATARGEEAAIIRADEATLPANASVLYMGDLNANPPEAEFTNLTASGQGQAFDPLNFSTDPQFLTESSTNLRYRDDYQLMTQNVLDGTSSAIAYVSGSEVAFGNDGTTPVRGSVDDPSNTALSDLSVTRSDVLSALTTASDHLPDVADYSFSTSSTSPPPVSPVPLPSALVQSMLGMGAILTAWVVREMRRAVR